MSEQLNSTRRHLAAAIAEQNRLFESAQTNFALACETENLHSREYLFSDAAFAGQAAAGQRKIISELRAEEQALMRAEGEKQ